MINLLLGGPGGGKSYEAVAFHVLPALKRGRKVITNLPLNLQAFEAIEPGSSALIEIRDKTLAAAPDVSHDAEGSNGLMGMIQQARAAKFVDRAFANAEDFASDWRHVDGHGPLYVIDECHFAMPRGGTSRAVEEWFSMHRHFNVDVLLITQSSGKISAAIKDLVQVCYKVRKAIALGKPDGYIRKVLDGVNGGEVSVSERKYKPEFFKLYRSHTQGMALDEQHADDVAPLLVRFNRFKWFFMAFTFCFLLYAFWPAGDKPKAVASSKPVWLDSAVQQHKSNPPSGPEFATPAALPASGTVAVQELPLEDLDPEPFKAQGLHLTGWMKTAKGEVHTFAVSAAGQLLFNLTRAELEKSGYKFQALGECAGLLRYGNKTRTVICDAPVTASGRNNYPVVLAGAAREPVAQ